MGQWVFGAALLVLSLSGCSSDGSTGGSGGSASGGSASGGSASGGSSGAAATKKEWLCKELDGSCSCNSYDNVGESSPHSCTVSYPCCANGVDLDGTTPLCICFSQAFLAGNLGKKTCDAQIAEANSTPKAHVSQVTACPVK